MPDTPGMPEDQLAAPEDDHRRPITLNPNQMTAAGRQNAIRRSEQAGLIHEAIVHTEAEAAAQKAAEQAIAAPDSPDMITEADIPRG